MRGNGAVGGRIVRASESVAALMRREILSGAIPAGAMFPPEAQLAAVYQVSRPTIREALRYLESDQLITIRRGKQGGAEIRPPSTAALAQYAGLLLQYRRARLSDVFAAKALIEPPSAAAVARRRDPEAVRQLRELIDEEDRNGDDDERSRQLGERFHELLVELAGNKTMRIYAAMINGLIAAHSLRYGGTSPETRVRLMAGHRRLTDLIEAGAALEAASFWREYLMRLAELLMSGAPPDLSVRDVLP